MYTPGKIYKSRNCMTCSTMFIPINPCERRCEYCKTACCLACGKTFAITHPKNRTKYCSIECYLGTRWAGHRIDVLCPVCGKTFSMELGKPVETCSVACGITHSWTKPTSRANREKSLKGNPAFLSVSRKQQLDEAREKRGPFTPEVVEKIRAARLRQRLPTKMTSIEQKLHDAFRRLRLKFVMHKTLFKRWQPDFVFEDAKLIVQADGTYWHGSDHAKARDLVFNETAAEAGWTVWRFSEQAINANSFACAKAVAKFVRSMQLSLPLTIKT